MTTATKTVLHRRVSYRALVERDGSVEVQSRQKSGEWARLMLGLDSARLPLEVSERLHDMIKTIVRSEQDDA